MTRCHINDEPLELTVNYTFESISRDPVVGAFDKLIPSMPNEWNKFALTSLAVLGAFKLVEKAQYMGLLIRRCLS
jgi:hypothetical protein